VALKILHTADWHIGKVLHRHALRDELELFLDWLYKLIKDEHVDVLLVSGDIFDLANPAVIDRKLYYNFLRRLISLDIKVIITGGNHDAVGMLNAPKEILSELNIDVIGGAEEDIADELIPILNKNGNVELVIAAVPFLRDKDLRSKTIDSQYKSRTEAIRAGVKDHYNQLAQICEEQYSGLPAIAMGHLYAKGVSTSESERDIHIGNAAAIDSSIFSSTYNYVALGHIHRPQIVDKNEYIRYSGSPIALSFSEKSDKKSIVIVNVENGSIDAPQLIEIPQYRSLHKIKGSLDDVSKKLDEFNPEYPLKSFVELEVVEDSYNALVLTQVDELVEKYSDEKNFTILKTRTTFKDKISDTSTLFEEGEHIEDLKTIDVFQKLMINQELPVEKQLLLTEAFREILDTINQTEQ